MSITREHVAIGIVAVLLGGLAIVWVVMPPTRKAEPRTLSHKSTDFPPQHKDIQAGNPTGESKPPEPDKESQTKKLRTLYLDLLNVRSEVERSQIIHTLSEIDPQWRTALGDDDVSKVVDVVRLRDSVYTESLRARKLAENSLFLTFSPTKPPLFPNVGEKEKYLQETKRYQAIQDAPKEARKTEAEAKRQLIVAIDALFYLQKPSRLATQALEELRNSKDLDVDKAVRDALTYVKAP